MKFEEVLPAFKKGKKIRRKEWFADHFIYREGHSVYNEDGVDYDFISSDQLLYDDWEVIEEPEPDWEYIIDSKCLCWFWDEESLKCLGLLIRFPEKKDQFQYKTNIHKGVKYFKHCCPVRKDEVTFYEDKEDER